MRRDQVHPIQGRVGDTGTGDDADVSSITDVTATDVTADSTVEATPLDAPELVSPRFRIATKKKGIKEVKSVADLKGSEKKKSREQIAQTYMNHPQPNTWRHPCRHALDPRGASRISWDCVIFICIMYNLIEIPLRLCFMIQSDPVMDTVNLLVDLLFLGDVVLNFRTGFYVNGMFNGDSKTICIRYLKGWFVLDLITSLPFYAFTDEEDLSNVQLAKTLKILKYQRVIKVFKLFQLFKLLKTWSALNSLAIVNFIKVSATVFFVAHFGSCLWTLCAVLDGGANGEFLSDSWPTRYFEISYIHDVPWQDLWLYGVYYSMVTLSSTGYGDVVPKTDLEVVCCCFLILTGSLVFGYIVANSLVMFKPDEHQQLFDENMKKLNNYLKNSRLPNNLRRKVRAHFEFMWMRSSTERESEILDELPPTLRTQCVTMVYRDIIETVPFLAELNEECVSLLVTRMKSIVVPQGEYIFLKGSVGDCMYIVQQGQVNEIYGNGSVKGTLRDGNYFGEFAVLANYPVTRHVDALSVAHTSLLKLDKVDYNAVLRIFPAHHAQVLAQARKGVQEMKQAAIANSGPGIELTTKEKKYLQKELAKLTHQEEHLKKQYNAHMIEHHDTKIKRNGMAKRKKMDQVEPGMYESSSSSSSSSEGEEQPSGQEQKAGGKRLSLAQLALAKSNLLHNHQAGIQPTNVWQNRRKAKAALFSGSFTRGQVGKKPVSNHGHSGHVNSKELARRIERVEVICTRLEDKIAQLLPPSTDRSLKSGRSARANGLKVHIPK